jgi:hypothetical protein
MQSGQAECRVKGRFTQKNRAQAAIAAEMRSLRSGMNRAEQNAVVSLNA